MKKYQQNEEVLRSVLKEYGLKKPSEEYSNHLTDLIQSKYQKKHVEEFKAHNWPAFIIVTMAILWSSFFLYALNPFSIRPAFCISVFTFILGFWALIVLIKKSQISL